MKRHAISFMAAQSEMGSHALHRFDRGLKPELRIAQGATGLS
jgi:hypothetical protein